MQLCLWKPTWCVQPLFCVISSASWPASAVVDLATCERRSWPARLGPARLACGPVTMSLSICPSIPSRPTSRKNCLRPWMRSVNSEMQPVDRKKQSADGVAAEWVRVMNVCKNFPSVPRVGSILWVDPVGLRWTCDKIQRLVTCGRRLEDVVTDSC